MIQEYLGVACLCRMPDEAQEAETPRRTMIMKYTARIFKGINGIFFCDDRLAYSDARGQAHRTKIEAIREAYCAGYTHGVGSGMPGGKPRALAGLLGPSAAEYHYEHVRNVTHLEEVDRWNSASGRARADGSWATG